MGCVLRTSPLPMMAYITAEQKSTLRGDTMNGALKSLFTVSLNVQQHNDFHLVVYSSLSVPSSLLPLLS